MGRRRLIPGAIKGPLRVAIEGKGFFNAVNLGFFQCLCGWDQGGTACEGMDGGEFVGKWLVAVECNVLVIMGGFVIDIKVEIAVRIANDIDIKHGNPVVFFDFFCSLCRLYNSQTFISKRK